VSRPTRYGTCSECGRPRALRQDGMVWSHQAPPPRDTYKCLGSGRPPKEEGLRERVARRLHARREGSTHEATGRDAPCRFCLRDTGIVLTAAREELAAEVLRTLDAAVRQALTVPAGRADSTREDG
jgi:hypothetical protein